MSYSKASRVLIKDSVMKQIEIDDEVFAYLQSKAVAFVETPNLTLRRLFQLDKPVQRSTTQKVTSGKSGRKKPKANLSTLISNGLLEEGQPLFLVDYQHNKLTQYRAVVNGTALKWEGRSYSMSELAKKLLQQEGYSSNSVRGPAHWCTEEGVTIKELWQQHLKSIS